MRQKIGDALTMNDMADEIKQAKGKVYFDQFRAEIDAYIADQTQDLADQRQAFTALVASGEVQPNALDQGLRAVERAYRGIIAAKALLEAAVDMETGMRGFLLAGEEAFLEPYSNGAARFDDLHTELMAASAGIPKEESRLGLIREIISDWRSTVVEPTLEMRREIGDSATMDDMADWVGEGHGKTYFDAFRALLTEFQAEEEALMTARQNSNDQISTETRWEIPIVIGAAVLVGLLLSLWVGGSLSRAIQGITTSMNGLAAGNNAVVVTGQNRGDEVGEMARALEVFRDELVKLQEAELMKAEGKDAELKTVVQVLSARLSRLSEGDLTVQIDEAFPAEYEALRTDFNGSINTLNATVMQVVESTSSI